MSLVADVWRDIPRHDTISQLVDTAVALAQEKASPKQGGRLIADSLVGRVSAVALACVLSACSEVGVESNTDVDRTAPSAPTGLQATAPDPQRVELQWTAATDTGTGVAGYRVFRSDLSTALATVTATSYQDTTVVAATSYSYFVTAIDGGAPINESSPTPLVSIRTPSVADTAPPAVPANVQAVASSATQINLTWNVSTDTGGSGLAGYRVFRDGGTTPVATVATASYSDANLTAGTAYSYVIRAFDGAGNTSAPSAAVSATTPVPPDNTPPPAPTSLTATAQGASAVQLSWMGSTDPSGIQRYDIQRDGVMIGQTVGNATTFVDSAVAPSTTYTYAVRAIDGANNSSAFSSTASVTTPAAADTTPPTSPSALAASTNGSQSIVLSWIAATDAGGSGLAGYRIFRGASQVGQVGAGVLNFTDGALDPNTQYTYVVRAFDGDGNVSGPSNSASATTGADTIAPSVPANLAATPISSNSVGLTWNASTDTGGSGLAGYRIYRGGALLTAVSAGSPTYTDTTVQLNSSYSYRVSAIDNAGNESAQSPAANVSTPGDTTAPTTPANLAAMPAGANQIALTWSASTDAGGSGLAGYRVFRDGGQVGQVASGTLTFTDSGLVPLSTHSYTVRAFDTANNESANSNVATATTGNDSTPPSAPGGLTATSAGSAQINLAWSAASDTGGSGLGGYRVFRDGNPVAVAQVGAGTLTYADTGLAPASTHSYTVRAFDNAGNVSPASNSAQATTAADTTAPSVPGNLAANSVLSNSVALTWSASTDTGGSGLAGYRIYRAGTLLTAIAAGTTTYTDSTAQPNTAYAYRVSAIDNAGNESAQSTPANVTTPQDTIAPTVPAGLVATPAGATQITLTWTAATDAGGSGLAGYRVFRDGSQVAQIGVAPQTYADTGLAATSTHSYVVRAFDAAGNESANSNVATATTGSDATPPSAPAGLTATAAGSTQINLAWSAATDTGGSGLAGYRVFRDGNSAPVAQLAAGTQTYADVGLAPASTHSYTVRAVDGAGNVSPASNTAQATTAPDTVAPSAPTNLVATAQSSTTIQLTWTASTDTGGSGVVGYRVFRGGSQIATSVAGTTYTDSSLSPNTLYAYTVRAVDSANNVSADSNSASATTPADTTAPPAPSGLNTNNITSTQIGLSWGGVTDTGGSGLAGYRVFRDGNQIAQVGTGVLTYLDTGLASSSTHTYTVRAFDAAGNESANSNAVTATTAADSTAPSAPAALTATAAGSTQINLSWSASTDTGGSGLAGYRVFRNGSQIATGVATTTYSDTNLTPNTNYSYVVRALDSAGNVSGPSNTAQAITAQDTTAPSVPTGLAASALSSTSIRLTWNASTDTGGSGAVSYRVFRGGNQIATGILGTTYTDSTALPSTLYTYTVRAVDGAGNVSGDSNSASATTPADTTPPSAPTGLTATNVTSTQVVLAWSASTDTGGSGLAGYRVLRNGSQIATGIGATTFTDTTVVAGTTYTYVVRAVDVAGNVSADSNSVQATPPSSQQSGLDSRPSNTTCLAPNQPTTNTSVTTQRVFPNLSFSAPILMLQAPGEPTNRWYVVEQRGTIQRFEGTNPTSATQWANLQSIVDDSASESGLLGMAFHPNYASNGRIFLSYTGAGAMPFQSHISEFARGSNGLLDTTTERIFIRLNQPYTNHNGGNILFGPDGNLYVGFGDGGSGGDPENRAQNRNNLFGKILRVNVNGAAPYAIPNDNPYFGNALCSAGSGSAPCPETYAYGLRNPWRWSFDRGASEPDLWLADVGQSAWEEVDRIVNGGNYGWRFREGAHCFNPSTNCPTTANGAPLIDPVAEYGRSIGQSTTGGYVYRGSAIASLRGRYVFGDFVSERLMYLAPNASGGFDRRDLIGSTGLNISSFAEDSAGELYITDYNGGIYKIVPGSGTITDTIPANLIDTGCVSLADPTQPASGLIPYAPNAPFWSDGADKVRWLAVPNSQTITIQSDGDWSFPNSTVLVKNFKLGTRLIETRLFMRHPDTGNWGGYTYQWNAAQTAATLVKGGLITHITSPSQDWIYPSEAQCLQCHTNAAGRSLGLETAQLNGDLTYPTTGRTANQLATLNAIGMFTTPLAQPPSALPAYPNPFGTSGTLAERARAYLHTNCSQCHRPSGGTPSTMDLRFSTAIGSTNTCSVSPTSGDLGIAGARLIAPGNSSSSLIWVRMSRRDLHQMPPLASNLVDTAGATLIRNWITAMNGSCQ